MRDTDKAIKVWPKLSFGAFSVKFGLACSAVILRLAARRICKAKLLADDYFVLAALVKAPPDPLETALMLR